MSKYQYFAGRFIIGFLCIVIGIPLGILLGLLYFLRASIMCPYQMYILAVDKWQRKVEIEQADIWTRHIARMEEKSRTRQDIKNN
jgi:hypothetical protein